MFKSNRIYKLVSLFLGVVMCLGLFGCAEKKVSSTEFALNTVITITAYGDKAQEAMDASFAEVKRIENLLSAYIDGSDISKINKSACDAPVEVSDETINVLTKALEMSQKTDGAFDITVKPLVDLWDIKSENPKIPSEDAINTAKNLVGYKDVVIDGNRVSFKKQGMKIDLGGAAKGYCADKVIEVLKSYGVKNALIDLGGNIYALGKNENGDNWRIGLQDPTSARGEHFSVEEISDKTAVTSGSYERYFEKDGKIYHHILNPETGRPADSGLISVTVISKNSFEADMLSTAVFVMGSEKFKEKSDNFNFSKVITVDKNNIAKTFEKQK
ncbi:MAG: FAD:protein FMN transferase [Clostridia bacterium]|nr:FAD:protein FMN transferase [Clostridia bacterium]